ncbi:uncharacterized protein LOC120115057 [Hibiscus syriacus]|uniref:uncharacterized protein LOC120115057 n=1 Tax=Hibiscus syriacus TaxID=106335 RepID=UPI0019204F84|nr:uncharacterized protein LOC120115057 [Hibiscus syriacus]
MAKEPVRVLLTGAAGAYYMEDSQLVNKPPYFNGANYAYWKNTMMHFIQVNDLGAWNSINKGYSTPPGEMDDWSDGEKKKFQLNAKATHFLFFLAFEEDSDYRN